MRLYLSLMSLFLTTAALSQNYYMYVGTYTNTGSKGIYVYRFNAQTGKASFVGSTDSCTNPSYLAISPNKKFLFAVNETNGRNPGRISAFSINPNTGRLTFINQQLSGGDDPCYVAVHKSNRWITASNYSGGSTSVLPVNINGSLKPAVQVIQDSGKGPNPERQEKAHIHSTVFSPDEQFLFTPDLGIDKIMAYRFNANAIRPLTPANPAHTKTDAGGGPRHLTFHPNNRFAYLMEEMAGNVSVFKYANGKLTAVQTIPAHPAGFKGNIGSADIHVSPDGKFLYASNRGDENNLAIFSINPATGRLQSRGYQSVLGKTPRNFTIDPTGNYLLAANQNSDNIVIFKRNKTTGQLTPTANQIQVPKPVCIKLM